MNYLRLVPLGHRVALVPQRAILDHMARYRAHPHYAEYLEFIAQWPDDEFPREVFPLGYRFLDEGERVQTGDLVLAYTPGDHWALRPYALYMDGFLDSNDCRVFRKIERGAR